MHYADFMHRYWLLMLAVAALEVSAADVYRTYDENGNPVFTDQPADDAEKIELQEITTVPGLKDIPPPAATPQAPAETYRLLTLVSPESERTYFRGEGPLPVTIRIEPALRGGDTLAVMLDGVVVQTGRSLDYSLPEIDRGTHQLSVAVRDRRGEVVKTSGPVTFYMRQASRLNQPAAAPGGG